MNDDTLDLPITDLAAATRPGDVVGTERSQVSIFAALRDRVSTRGSFPDPTTDDDRKVDPGLPFAGYDRLKDRAVIDALSDHSQVELEAVETYERSHKAREAVLDKLRYMRGSEPLPGYDALTVDEIVDALERADLATIKKVRGYERKFAHRPHVLEAVNAAQHRAR